MEIGRLILELCEYAKNKNLISEGDCAYTVSRLMEILSVSSIEGEPPGEVRGLSEILGDI